MKPSVRLDHCVVHVSAWRRSNAFYRDVLGAQQLNVHGPGVDAAPVVGVPGPPGGSDLCFVWPGPISDAEHHLRRHGVEVEMGPVERRGAGGVGKSVYFGDPDGSLPEFISYADA